MDQAFSGESRGPVHHWREKSPAIVAFLGLGAGILLFLAPDLPLVTIAGSGRRLQAEVALRGSTLRIRNLETHRWNGIYIDIETGRSNGTFHFPGEESPTNSIAPGEEMRIPLRFFIRADGATLDSLRHDPRDIRIQVANPAGEFWWRGAWSGPRGAMNERVPASRIS